MRLQRRTAVFRVIMPRSAAPHFLSSDSQIHSAFKESKTLGLGAVLVIALLPFVRYIKRPFRKLPPGPLGLPVLGNALSLRPPQWVVFTEWKRKYGMSDFIRTEAFAAE